SPRANPEPAQHERGLNSTSAAGEVPSCTARATFEARCDGSPAMEPRFDEPMNAPVPPRRDASKLRAADADRQQVAEQLRSAVDEGRLTLDEYDERLTAVYAAKTYGDLSRLTADLPAPASGQPVPGPRTPSSETHG